MLDPFPTQNQSQKQSSSSSPPPPPMGVLIGTDGPLHNVIKLKPPMCFNAQNAEYLGMKTLVIKLY